MTLFRVALNSSRAVPDPLSFSGHCLDLAIPAGYFHGGYLLQADFFFPEDVCRSNTVISKNKVREKKTWVVSVLKKYSCSHYMILEYILVSSFPRAGTQNMTEGS